MILSALSKGCELKHHQCIILSAIQSISFALWPLLILVSIMLTACHERLVKQAGKGGSRPAVVNATPSNSRPFDAGAAAFERGQYAVALLDLEPRAEAGDPTALYLLGQMYRESSPHSRNGLFYLKFKDTVVREYKDSVTKETAEREAVRLFEGAAKQGHLNAQLSLCGIYAKNKSYSDAEKWCAAAVAQAAAQEDTERTAYAHVALGQVYENKYVEQKEEAPDSKKFFEYYGKLVCPLQGDSGVGSNLEKAMWHYKKALCLKPIYVDAIFRLSCGLIYGTQRAQDPDNEIKKTRCGLLEIIREHLIYEGQKGNKGAQYELYVLLRENPGMKRYETEEKSWLDEAANNGHIEALHVRLMNTYRERIKDRKHGDDDSRKRYRKVLPDLSDLFRSAYADGDFRHPYPLLRKTFEPTIKDRIGEAREALAYMFRNGIGVEHDKTEAGYWKDLADSKEEKKLGHKDSGSGFYILGDYILTNWHVVVGSKGDICEEVRIPYGLAHVVKFDKKTDLALLKAQAQRKAPSNATIRPTWPEVGERIFAFGYPLPQYLSLEGNFTDGSVSAPISLEGNSQGEFQHTAPIQPGNSGGPLFDETGAVIGINTRVLNSDRLFKERGLVAQNVNFAIGPRDIFKFLRSSKSENVEVVKSDEHNEFIKLLAKKHQQYPGIPDEELEPSHGADFPPETRVLLDVTPTEEQRESMKHFLYSAPPQQPRESKALAALARNVSVRLTCWQQIN